MAAGIVSLLDGCVLLGFYELLYNTRSSESLKTLQATYCHYVNQKRGGNLETLMMCVLNTVCVDGEGCITLGCVF